MTDTIRLELAGEAKIPEHVEAIVRDTFPELELFRVEIIDQGGNVVRISEGAETRGQLKNSP